MQAIEASGLVKQYKNGVRALDNLNFTVKAGEVFSLLGQNGAGKSTLINILTTYLPPTSGSINLLGKDINREAGFIRSQIACVAQKITIDMHLSLAENMIFQGRLHKVESAVIKVRMKNLTERFGLEQYLEYPVNSYSGGVKRRLDIAMNLMSNPKILFLDEPTVGMDIQSRIAMWDMVKKIREDFGTTIFLTTHYLEEADLLSDTICIIKNGHEIVQASPHALRHYIRQDVLRLGFDSESQAKECEVKLKEKFKINSIDIKSSSILLHVNNPKEVFVDVNRWLLEQQIDFLAIEIIQPSLDDVFLNLTKADGKEEEL